MTTRDSKQIVEFNEVFLHVPFEHARLLALYDFAVQYHVHVYLDSINIVSLLSRVDISKDLLVDVPAQLSWSALSRHNMHLWTLVEMFSAKAPAFVDVSVRGCPATYASRAAITGVFSCDNYVVVDDLSERYHLSTILSRDLAAKKARFSIVPSRCAVRDDVVIPIHALKPGLYHAKESHETFFIDVNGYCVVFRPRNADTVDAFFLAQHAKQHLGDLIKHRVEHDGIYITPDLRGITVYGTYVDSIDGLSKVLHTLRQSCS